MNFQLLSFLFLFTLSALAQTPAFQQFEVDSAAEPRCGTAFFNTFIQTNLRKPVSLEAKGIGGTVIVNGVVEPNGTLSNVAVSRGFRPDCDREALRVFSLFNAWKPAQKAGKAVRQQITIPIVFKPNVAFTYLNGKRIVFFTKDGKATNADSTLAQFKQVSQVDSTGLPTGDVVVYEAKNKKWKEYYRLVFTTEKYTNPFCNSCQTIGNQNIRKQWQGDVFVLDGTGKRIRQTYYDEGSPTNTDVMYYPNSLIAQKKADTGDRVNFLKWYANGQIEQIKTLDKPKSFTTGTLEQIVAVWDSTGKQTVIDGNGYATYQEQVVSNNDTTKHTIFVEKGTYAAGVKQGIWKGYYTDGSFFYEEMYEKGIFQGGKSKSNQGDTLRYTQLEQVPEFQGGMAELGKFLSTNLSYPVDAQRAGVQGRVFVSFVVCTDGTLCDYEILKGVQPDVDQEALRVVKSMNGKWKPGFQRGKAVRVKYNLPINFSLH
ncbi:energy transducer TonB [Spirosoma sp. BT702]|uniref:Energy transducer TonB n=1 Tax=Spirosoma profusum TaxID=2771354 RepID=A0A927AVS2_9BACT|nr:energy transducer TonB [Spirosoma profusum]MBD2705274.1 energy transducer TonB [Spirosoma profusum]